MKKIKLLTITTIGASTLASIAPIMSSCSNADVFKVTFDLNYLSAPAYETKEVKSGQAVAEPTKPTRKGYTFIGWFKERECLNQYDFATKVSSAFTLYAGWKQDTIEHTVQFNTNGGSEISPVKVIDGNKLARPEDPTKLDHYFVGWYKDEACEKEPYDFNTPVKSSFTLHAKWYQDTGKRLVVFAYNDGKTDPLYKEINVGETVDKPTDPTREHYTFDNWYTTDGEVWDFTTPVNNSMILFANWIADKITVTFESNGGTAVEQSIVDYDTKLPMPQNPNKERKLFRGWYTNSSLTNKYDFSTPVTAPFTLYAKWEDQPSGTWQVIFDTQGANEQFEPLAIKYDQKIDRAEMPADPTKDGCKFLGWYKSESGSEPWDFDKDVVRVPTTLYALWSPNGITQPEWANAFNVLYVRNEQRNFHAEITGDDWAGDAIKLDVDNKYATANEDVAGWKYEDYSNEYPVYLWTNNDYAITYGTYLDTESLFYLPYTYLKNNYNYFSYDDYEDVYKLTKQIWITSSTQINAAVVTFNEDKLISNIYYDIKYEGVEYKYNIALTNYGTTTVTKPTGTPDLHHVKSIEHGFVSNSFSVTKDKKVGFFAYLTTIGLNDKPTIQLLKSGSTPITFEISSIYSDTKQLECGVDYTFEDNNKITFLKEPGFNARLVFNLIPSVTADDIVFTGGWDH